MFIDEEQSLKVLLTVRLKAELLIITIKLDTRPKVEGVNCYGPYYSPVVNSRGRGGGDVSNFLGFSPPHLDVYLLLVFSNTVKHQFPAH